jgi:hypothetical protein
MSLLRIGEIKIKPTKLSDTGRSYYIFTGATFDGPKGTVGDYYDEITSNESWMTIGVKHYDYSFCRNQVMTWTAVNSFSALTTEEQIVAATHFAVGDVERASVLTDEEQQLAWSELVQQTRKARQLRWDAAKAYISYTLDMPDSIDLGKSTTDLTNDYITYGVESFAEDGVNGLFDYLENTSDYAGSGGNSLDGYVEKPYWNQVDQDKMMDILRNGNY